MAAPRSSSPPSSQHSHPTSLPPASAPHPSSATPAPQSPHVRTPPSHGRSTPQDEQLLDYGNSPSPISKPKPRVSQEMQQDKACNAATRKLTFREVLQSPPPSHSSCSLPDSGKESLGSIAAPKPKLRNILVLPDRAIQQPTPQRRAGHSVSLSMKTSGCVDNRSQTATRSTPIHGWQEVRRKVWRKKLTNPSLQPRRSVHERLQGPEASARQTDSSQKQPPQSSWLEAFKRQTNGRCFRCLASNHRVADCRDPGRL
jgi:hypothetical protein